MANKNNMCDGAHCLTNKGQVKVLSTGGDSNAILCRSCFNYEIAFRKERNKKLGKKEQFKLPLWEDLKIYDPGE